MYSHIIFINTWYTNAAIITDRKMLTYRCKQHLPSVNTNIKSFTYVWNIYKDSTDQFSCIKTTGQALWKSYNTHYGYKWHADHSQIIHKLFVAYMRQTKIMHRNIWCVGSATNRHTLISIYVNPSGNYAEYVGIIVTYLTLNVWGPN